MLKDLPFTVNCVNGDVDISDGYESDTDDVLCYLSWRKMMNYI